MFPGRLFVFLAIAVAADRGVSQDGNREADVRARGSIVGKKPHSHDRHKKSRDGPGHGWDPSSPLSNPSLEAKLVETLHNEGEHLIAHRIEDGLDRDRIGKLAAANKAAREFTRQHSVELPVAPRKSWKPGKRAQGKEVSDAKLRTEMDKRYSLVNNAARNAAGGPAPEQQEELQSSPSSDTRDGDDGDDPSPISTATEEHAKVKEVDSPQLMAIKSIQNLKSFQEAKRASEEKSKNLALQQQNGADDEEARRHMDALQNGDTQDVKSASSPTAVGKKVKLMDDDDDDDLPPNYWEWQTGTPIARSDQIGMAQFANKEKDLQGDKKLPGSAGEKASEDVAGRRGLSSDVVLDDA